MISSSSPRLLVVGKGAHSTSLAELLSEEKPNALIEQVFFSPVPSSGQTVEDLFSGWNPPKNTECEWFLGLGENAIRMTAFSNLLRLGFRLSSFIHSSSVVCSRANLGTGVFLGALSYVGPFASVGDAVIVNTGAVVEHDVTLGDGCHIGPNATVLGNVKLGREVLIGAGSVVLPGLTLADFTTVGAGSVVTRDVFDTNTVGWGSPAKFRKAR